MSNFGLDYEWESADSLRILSYLVDIKSQNSSGVQVTDVEVSREWGEILMQLQNSLHLLPLLLENLLVSLPGVGLAFKCTSEMQCLGVVSSFICTLPPSWLNTPNLVDNICRHVRQHCISCFHACMYRIAVYTCSCAQQVGLGTSMLGSGLHIQGSNSIQLVMSQPLLGGIIIYWDPIIC